ncbi:hypothetical protein [Novipirellula artificiosorum]|uniref:Uncharacterized protein n=1 Tax=Novipirellula artificiosorum TaxID=2528016 RepID=A0A5C6D5M7_9BACT|nr:hypothetical protein [Novipirellula artificiosorum]TWU31144.1 hypothetical protein Poly41_63350 [Novipirellula artificiosorum]
MFAFSHCPPSLLAQIVSGDHKGTVESIEARASSEEALDDAGIDMPYPTNVMLFHYQTQQTGGGCLGGCATSGRQTSLSVVS